MGDPGRGPWVSLDRWDAEHRALRDHEDGEHRRLDTRIDGIQAAVSGIQAEKNRSGDRRWNILMAVLSGLILPLMLLAVVALVTALRLGG